MTPSDFRGRTDLPRGLRNNNPGNADKGENWQGAVDGSDSRFCTFKDISWGIRAWIIIYHAYIFTHECDTLDKFITRYAPPNENNTAAYIRAVSEETGVNAGDKMPVDKDGVHSMFTAFAAHENGHLSGMITDEDFAAGWALQTLFI